MCHGPDARPPYPPISGGATETEGREIELQADDGTLFAAYAATTLPSGGPGIVILPDVRGLHRFYRDLALRFAEAGVHATAIDYFGRTAGIGERSDDFDYMPHVQQTKPDQIAHDVAAAVGHVRSPEGGGAERVFSVGFCFGGRQSFNQAAQGHGLAGVIGFYGRVTLGNEEDPSPADLASRFECPVLGLFGGADQGISTDDVEQFRTALEDADVPNEIVVYDDAPHSFFDRTYEQYRDACDDAWKRILRFVGVVG
jgi:carboxymethylenebutenolidase